MKLEPANIVCPTCGNANYMRHLIGNNVDYFDLKCMNCNSYFNFDELYKWHTGEALKPKPITNADRIRSMTDEELADMLQDVATFGGVETNCDKLITWLDWLKQECES